MLVSSGATYLDLAEEEEQTASPVLINTFPADGQDDIPAADKGGSHPIHLTVVDPAGTGLLAGTTTVTITIAGVPDVVFDGTTFSANWIALSTFTPVASDGSATIDEHRFVLIRDNAFASLDVVTVDVHAEVA